MKKYSLRLKYLTLLMVSLLVVLTWWLRSGIIQEPPTTMLVAARLELERVDILPIRTDHTEWIFRTGIESSQSPLTHLLATAGWVYVDQMGAGWFYEKQGERAIVSCRLYSTRYMICLASMPLT